MSRRRREHKREFKGDSRYGSQIITRFINRMMLDGKKSVAEKVTYGALELLAKETSETPLDSFMKALKNVMPSMEVKSRRVGGSTYQVPIEVKSDRAVALGMRWIIGNARKRSGRSMIEKLSQELIDAYKESGASVKKREDTHKMADANKAFAHFRF